MSVHHFTDDNFTEEVLNATGPVLVDFWAEWCGPCRMVAPVVEQIAREYTGKLKVGKVDVDASSQTASAYGVMSIPTLIFFKEGKVQDQVVGVLSKSQLKRKVDEHLG
ncbi:MAG: thioredoxin [Candidatus Omnitrophica bacterium]|nr:thioredoxin [Candidatus Omnitrophota bacterium]